MQYRQLYTKNGEKEMETLQNSKLNSVWQMCTQHRMYEKKEAKQMSQLVPGMHWPLHVLSHSQEVLLSLIAINL